MSFLSGQGKQLNYIEKKDFLTTEPFQPALAGKADVLLFRPEKTEGQGKYRTILRSYP